MKRYFLLFFMLSIIFIVSCYYDSEEALYPTYSSACDTTNVTFSGTIVPVLSSNCLACHSNATAAAAGNNIRLENYADVTAKQPNITGSIKHTGTYSPMPKNGGKLKTCSITQWDIWVRKGMPDN
jgi:hypothetical protein